MSVSCTACDRFDAATPSQAVLLPGQRITKQGLVAETGLGKTPVREALARLVNEPVVDVMPRSGYRVREVTLQDADEILELWGIVWPETVALASQRITPLRLDQRRASDRRRLSRAPTVSAYDRSIRSAACSTVRGGAERGRRRRSPRRRPATPGFSPPGPNWTCSPSMTWRSGVALYLGQLAGLERGDHWHEALGEPTIADGILDRLVHNANRIELHGESLRKAIEAVVEPRDRKVRPGEES